MKQTLRPASVAGGTFDRYFHACAFFRGREEEHRILSPFLTEGMENGEKAIYIVDPAVAGDHESCLCRHGVPIETRPTQWQMLDWNQTYLAEAKFDPDKMLAAVTATIEAGLAAGFPRSRIVGQMGWALREHPGSDRLLEYEIKVNDVLSQTRQPAICVYEVSQLNGSTMMDLLRAHPLTIVNGTLYENPFFTPPERMLSELRTQSA